MKTVKLSVKGMHCDGCVSRVASALEEVEGVRGVEVSLDEEEARVEADDAAVGESLLRAVQEAGYEAAVKA